MLCAGSKFASTQNCVRSPLRNSCLPFSHCVNNSGGSNVCSPKSPATVGKLCLSSADECELRVVRRTKQSCARRIIQESADSSPEPLPSLGSVTPPSSDHATDAVDTDSLVPLQTRQKLYGLSNYSRSISLHGVCNDADCVDLTSLSDSSSSTTSSAIFISSDDDSCQSEPEVEPESRPEPARNAAIATRLTSPKAIVTAIPGISASLKLVPKKVCKLPRTQQQKTNGQAIFLKQREALARELYAHWNQTVFGGKLQVDLPIVWNPRLVSTAGQVLDDNSQNHRKHHAKQRIPCRLELSKKIIDNEERLRNTLAHEMCHVAAWSLDDEYHVPHGAAFWKWAQRFAPVDIIITRCHNYEIHRPHRWQCENLSCAKLYQRHKVTIDVSRHRCGECRGKLKYLGKFNRKEQPANQVAREHAAKHKSAGAGTALTPNHTAGQAAVEQPGVACPTAPRPTAYQEFVKNTFAKEKKRHPPGTPIGTIMKSVAARWQEHKQQATQPCLQPQATSPPLPTTTSTRAPTQRRPPVAPPSPRRNLLDDLAAAAPSPIKGTSPNAPQPHPRPAIPPLPQPLTLPPGSARPQQPRTQPRTHHITGIPSNTTPYTPTPGPRTMPTARTARRLPQSLRLDLVSSDDEDESEGVVDLTDFVDEQQASQAGAHVAIEADQQCVSALGDLSSCLEGLSLL